MENKLNGVSEEYLKKAEEYLSGHWNNIGNGHLNYPRHQKRIKHTGSFVVGEDCLEIGAANGYSTNCLQNWFPNTKFYGIEITEWGVKEAQKNYPHIPFDRGCAENLIYDDETFDTVLMPEILEHVENPEPCIREAFRVAKKRVILTSPVNERGMRADIDHKRYFTEETMKALLIKCGIDPSKAKFAHLDDKGDGPVPEEKAYFGITIIDK